MQKELLQKTQIDAIGQHIGYEAGEEMVKRFYDKHPDQAFGHIVGRNIIEKILAQPDCSGIGVLPAYNDQGQRQLVFVGLNSNGRPILQYNIVNAAGEIDTEEGIVSDKFKTDGWAV